MNLRAALDTILDGWLPAAAFYACYVVARIRKAARLGWAKGTTAEETSR